MPVLPATWSTSGSQVQYIQWTGAGSGAQAAANDKIKAEKVLLDQALENALGFGLITEEQEAEVRSKLPII